MAWAFLICPPDFFQQQQHFPFCLFVYYDFILFCLQTATSSPPTTQRKREKNKNKRRSKLLWHFINNINMKMLLSLGNFFAFNPTKNIFLLFFYSIRAVFFIHLILMCKLFMLEICFCVCGCAVGSSLLLHFRCNELLYSPDTGLDTMIKSQVYQE